jgi:hypothetical protein
VRNASNLGGGRRTRQSARVEKQGRRCAPAASDVAFHLILRQEMRTFPGFSAASCVHQAIKAKPLRSIHERIRFWAIRGEKPCLSNHSGTRGGPSPV